MTNSDWVPDSARVFQENQPTKCRESHYGEISSAPNLPKSSEGIVFVRGTGVDSSDKRECVNGVRMYCQRVWIKGSYLAELVNQPF